MQNFKCIIAGILLLAGCSSNKPMNGAMNYSDIKNANGEKIGQYGYLKISDDQFSNLSEEDVTEFYKSNVVDSKYNSKYNYVILLSNSGKGILFNGNIGILGDIKDGQIISDEGMWTCSETGCSFK